MIGFIHILLSLEPQTTLDVEKKNFLVSKDQTMGLFQDPSLGKLANITYSIIQ